MCFTSMLCAACFTYMIRAACFISMLCISHLCYVHACFISMLCAASFISMLYVLHLCYVLLALYLLSMLCVFFSKSTDQGLYTNFNSNAPLAHKKLVVKILIHRALRYSSDWNAYHSEINRIKQVIADNFPPAHDRRNSLQVSLETFQQ